GHREDAFGVVFELRMDFVGKGVTGTSAAGACGIAALNHEAVDDAMEDDAVVKILFRQLDEIRHRVGGLLIEEFDGEIPHRRFKTGVSAGLRSEEHTSELQSRFDLVCRLLLEKKKIYEDIADWLTKINA